uniref:Far11/STRP C-terminal domain-containing protein n=1 Tax=Romanomermis culicivorax TaxID=13658 RepID=A0A915KLT9_ROMCU
MQPSNGKGALWKVDNLQRFEVEVSVVATLNTDIRELDHPIPVNGFGSGVSVSGSYGLEQHASFASLIFDAVSRFCTSSAPHFPIKKLMLLLWKTVLTSLGDLDQLKRKKNGLRMKLGLTPADDTVLVACTMEPVQFPSPAFGTTCSTLADFISAPSNPGDMLGYPKRERPLLAKRQLACMAVDDEEKKPGEGVDEGFEDVPEDPDSRKEADSSPETHKAPGTSNDSAHLFLNAEKSTTTKRSDSPRPELEPPTPVPPPVVHQAPNVLPWSLKVRPQEIGSFLERERAKFFKFQLQDDTSTLTGLPNPILDCVDTLKKHVYVSLADKQVEREKLLNQYPFSHKEHYASEFETVENLYRSILPHVAQYVIGLLKILLAGAPTSKPKTDSVNLLSEILTPNSLNAYSAAEAGNTISQDVTPSSSISEEMAHMTLEINRHKEILVKAISALTLLLLKHFKANHVYQAEYLSQHLVFANCIPLILKFFDQNVLSYVQSENELKNLSFPANVLVYAKRKSQGDKCRVDNALEATLSLADALIEDLTNRPKKRFLWRNMFTSVNLLRILNKLTKWKHARTMMLVVFKSAPVLKRSLRVKHILIQLYALKLLKMQAKYLGRQWRKTNMELMSAIYNKVRHR